MVRIFKTIDGAIHEIQEPQEGCWIALTNPTATEIFEISEQFGIEVDDLRAPLDEEERSRIEVEDNYTLILADVPAIEERNEKDWYVTIPLGIIVTQKMIFTVCLEDTQVLTRFMEGRVRNFFTYMKTRFILQILYRNASMYLRYLRIIDKKSEQVEEKLHMSTRNQELLIQLKALNEQIQGNTELSQQFSALIAQKISELESQNASLQSLVASLKNDNKGIQNAVTTAQSTRTSLEKLTKDSKESLQDYRSYFAQTLMPQLNQSLDSLASLSGSLSSTLDGVEPTVEQMKSILNQLNSSLKDSASALGQTKEVLKRVDESLASVQDDLGALQSSQMYQKLTSLEWIDADSIAGFMSSPVSVQSKVLYDVENYGSGMTPFYTNLALWVGGLILVSILKQEVDKDETISRFTPTTAYFGRWMLFVVVGLIQGFIVCMGDLLLLKVQCVHPVAFVCAGMLCSFVYVNLIYAMALTFKHIGKALAVVLVILQIPGSSGTYPIEMTPVFFQRLHPLLPFSYGIGAMRECIAGFYKNNYAKNLLTLLLFLLLAFFIGLLLRPLLMNLNHLFDKRLAETDLMLGETATGELSRPQLTLMMKTMMQDEDGRADFIRRANRFEKRYPKLIRTGFILILVIPLIFLLLMFSLESKIIYLTLWIISLIVLAVYLICVEYIHDKTSRQLSYIHLSEEEFFKKVKEGKDK